MSRRCDAIVAAMVLPTALLAGAQTSDVRYTPWDDARLVVETLREDLLPDELRLGSPDALEAIWPDWASSRDRQIRARLARGDEDAVVNFLLFGTSFTRERRLTPEEVAALTAADGETPEALAVRIQDMVDGIASPGENERLQFARTVLERRGLDPETGDGRDELRRFLARDVRRGPAETMSISDAIGAAIARGDPDATMMDLTAFRHRGISSDTSVLVDYAIERALDVMKDEGVIPPEGIERVGLVGPGLDFTDKDGGFDFYPQQSIQPFAVIDALVGLGLARADTLRVTTFDVNPRITRHLEAARERAGKGLPYRLVLPRDLDRPWNPTLVEYWTRVGEYVGNDADDVEAPPNAGNVRARSIDVRPDVVASIDSRDLNIVLQRLDTRPDRMFDLIIATDVLIYYDVFEQSLALANVASMLRSGGVFLTNNAVFALPGTPMSAVGQTTVGYMPLPGIGELNDQLIWYRNR